MDITVYLPDEIGERAKAAPGLNLSRLLRDAVTDALQRREAMAKTLSESQEHQVGVEDKDGRFFTGRITGSVIAISDDLTVYLTDDERVLVHDSNKLRYWEVDDAQEELRDLTGGAYQDAMDALGLEAIIDL